MEPVQVIVLLMAAAFKNASLGQYNSSQFIPQLSQWADENNPNNSTSYVVDKKQDKVFNKSANNTGSDDVSFLLSEKEEWKNFTSTTDWDFVDKSVLDHDAAVSYIIYSFLYLFSSWFTHPNIFEDLTAALINEKEKVMMSLHVTEEILNQSTDQNQMLTFESFYDQFVVDYNAYGDKLEALRIEDNRREFWSNLLIEEPVQDLMLLMADAFQDAALGHYYSSQFVSQLSQWADENSSNNTNYRVEEGPDLDNNFNSANLTGLDEANSRISENKNWENFTKSEDWDFVDKSVVDQDASVSFVIYSFFYTFSLLPTYPNIFRDLSSALINVEQKVLTSLHVTEQILKQSHEYGEMSTFESFYKQFGRDYNAYELKLWEIRHREDKLKKAPVIYKRVPSLVLIMAGAVRNTSLGYINFTQFISELGQWAENNGPNDINYIKPGNNTNSDGFKDLEKHDLLISKKVKWKDFVRRHNWDTFDDSGDKDANYCYVIYSFLHSFFIAPTHPNMFNDLNAALINEEQRVKLSLHVTEQILKKSQDSDRELTFESFEQEFIQDYNAHNDKLHAAKKRREELFNFLFYGVGLILIGLFGVVGNILSIIVLASPKMRSSFSVLLIGLATSDIVALLNEVIFQAIPIVLNSGAWKSWILHICDVLSRSGEFGSMFFTMAITVERYLVVCHPLKSRNICTSKKSALTVGVVFILANLANVLRIIENVCYMQPSYHPKEGSITAEYCQEKHATEEHIRFKTGRIILDTILVFILPVTILLIFNTLIYLKIRESNTVRKRMANSSTTSPGANVKEHSITKILFAIAVTFMITHIPMRTLLTIDYNGIWTIPYQAEMYTVVVPLYWSQFALNFLIYMVFGKNFRNRFSEIFCGCRKCVSSGQNSHSNTLTTKLSIVSV